jgi:MFS family permease
MIFLLHGAVWGSWVPHIPLAKERLEVGTGVFGLALLAIAAGAVIAMPLAGALINRLGSARMTAITGILFFATFIGPVLAPTLAAFVIVAFCFGAAIGSMDVAMNAHGIAVERALRLPTMSLFHGAFSIGGMLGAFLGAAALGVMGEWTHAFIVAFLLIAVFTACLPFLLPATADRGLSGSSFAWPTRATIGLGLLCFLALMAEGSVIDWSAIMLRGSFALDAGTAALGYGLFSAGMAISRLLGDGLRVGFGSMRLVRSSAVLTAVALVAAVSLPNPWAAIAAFAFAGFGIGNLAPVLFAGGGRLEPDAPGRGIAAVTTLGYSGFLAGPPFIGFVAEVTGLPAALGLMAVTALVIAAFARAAAAADTY